MPWPGHIALLAAALILGVLAPAAAQTPPQPAVLENAVQEPPAPGRERPAPAPAKAGEPAAAPAAPAAPAEGGGPAARDAKAADADASAEGEPWRLGRVEFKGFEHVSSRQAEEVIQMNNAGWLDFSRRPEFDPLQVERDRQRLQSLYREEGYFAAKVTATTQEAPGSHRVNVVFTAQEGLPVRLDKIDLQVSAQDDASQWYGQLMDAARKELKPGQRLRMERYQKAKDHVRVTLADNARPLAVVQGQVRIYEKERRAVVVLRVDVGPRVLFGPVRVEGNEDIDTDYINKVRTFSRGQPFSQQAMEETQSSLLDTGLFSSVEIKPRFQEMTGDQVPVVIKVFERDAHSVRMGVGWGTEDLFRVKLSQVNRNMFGWDETLTFEGKVSDIYEGLVGRMLIPYVLSQSTNLLITGGLEQEDAEAYKNRRQFVSPVLEWVPPGPWRFYGGFTLERDKLLEAKTTTADPGFEERSFYIPSINLGGSYDSRDSMLNPTRGTYMSLDVDLTLQAWASDLSYIRPRGEIRHIMPLEPLLGWSKFYLAGRLYGGMIWNLPGTDSIPLIKRFYLGGPDDVRGYPYQRMGPLDNNGFPLGGEAFGAGSLELRFPIWKELGGVVFVDAGQMWESLAAEFPPIRFTTGVGLRYATPVGPLRADLGYQLNPPSNNDFDGYEFYLSVGQAF